MQTFQLFQTTVNWLSESHANAEVWDRVITLTLPLTMPEISKLSLSEKCATLCFTDYAYDVR